jgi:hypothetical protein
VILASVETFELFEVSLSIVTFVSLDPLVDSVLLASIEVLAVDFSVLDEETLTLVKVVFTVVVSFGIIHVPLT